MLLVMPQATRSFRPMINAGTPTYAIPATWYDPPHRWTSCQHPVVPKAMCGSLASRGRPLALRPPSTAQLLLPDPSPGAPAASLTRSTGSRDDGYEPDGTMLS